VGGTSHFHLYFVYNSLTFSIDGDYGFIEFASSASAQFKLGVALAIDRYESTCALWQIQTLLQYYHILASGVL
jgi:hypothetical protein